MRLARIADDMVDEIAFLATLRYEDRNLVAGLFAERGRKSLIRFASRSCASISVRVVTNSIWAVWRTIWAMRFEWTRPIA